MNWSNWFLINMQQTGKTLFNKEKWPTSYLPGYNFRHKEKIPLLDLSILLCKIGTHKIQKNWKVKEKNKEREGGSKERAI